MEENRFEHLGVLIFLSWEKKKPDYDENIYKLSTYQAINFDKIKMLMRVTLHKHFFVSYFCIPFLREYVFFVLLPGVACGLFAVWMLVRNFVLIYRDDNRIMYREPEEPVRIVQGMSPEQLEKEVVNLHNYVKER